MIDSDGTQLGILSTRDAINMAKEKGLDLVEVASKAKPPVCKIQDYGRAKFEINKRRAEQKKIQKAKQQEVKEVKFRPKTAEHDYRHKTNRVLKFLSQNDKVKVTIMFRGRERSHPEIAQETLMRVAREAQEVGQIESMPRHEGRTMWLMLAPRKSRARTPQPTTTSSPRPPVRREQGPPPATTDTPEAEPAPRINDEN